MQQNMNKNRIQVEIFGDKYKVMGSAEGEYIKQVADYVDKKMIFIGQRNPHLSIKQVAVLAALNIADELYQLQNDYDKLVQILEEENKS